MRQVDSTVSELSRRSDHTAYHHSSDNDNTKRDNHGLELRKNVMEVFKAVADFTPPASKNEPQCLLSFCKGDQFEVLDRTKSDWWGARRLDNSLVGYVPAKYLQFEERRIGKLLSDDNHEHRERQLKKFAAMQNSSHDKHPVSIYGEFGVPMDYEIPPLDPPGLPAEHQITASEEDDAAAQLLQRSFYGYDLPAPSSSDHLPPPCSDDLPPPSDYLPPPSGSPEWAEPHIPSPDYDPDTPVAERNSIVFVEKFKDVISHISTIEELYSEVPEPVPDYHDEDSNEFPPPPPPIAGDNPSPPGDSNPTPPPTIIGVGNEAEGSPEDEGDQIPRRKLFNPCVASRERQALHKELLMNYKLGKDVLQKPELNKILAKRKENQKRREWEGQQANRRTSLELRLEEQANKLKEKEDSEKMKTIVEDGKAPEFVQMHRRITHKTPTSPPT